MCSLRFRVVITSARLHDRVQGILSFFDWTSETNFNATLAMGGSKYAPFSVGQYRITLKQLRDFTKILFNFENDLYLIIFDNFKVNRFRSKGLNEI